MAFNHTPGFQRRRVATIAAVALAFCNNPSSAFNSAHVRRHSSEGSPFALHARGLHNAVAATPPNPLLDSFRPRQVSHVEIIVNEGATLGGGMPTACISENEEARMRKSIVDKRIADLLSDDSEEEDELDHPDCSDEAANKIADDKVAWQMSDLAKAKASGAMSKSGTVGAASDSSDSTAMGTDLLNRNKKRSRILKKKRVTATVQETGRDTIQSYTKSFTNHELLSREAEAALGREIQKLVRWNKRRMEIEVELLRPPTVGEWAQGLDITVPELKKQIRKSQRAKAALVEANLRLVVTSARQTVKQNKSEISFHDACQDGIIGLNRACEKFDPDREFRFSTYALWWIKGEITKSVNSQSSFIRLPASARKKINDIRINERILMTEMGRKPNEKELAKRCDMTVRQLNFYRRSAGQVVSIDQKLIAQGGKGSTASGDSAKKVTEIGDLIKDAGPSPAELASSQMLKDDVRRLVRSLSPREQVVIRLRFGLDDGKPKSLDEIGKKFGVETENIRKIEARALRKLRQPYRSETVEGYVPDL